MTLWVSSIQGAVKDEGMLQRKGTTRQLTMRFPAIVMKDPMMYPRIPSLFVSLLRLFTLSKSSVVANTHLALSDDLRGIETPF